MHSVNAHAANAMQLALTILTFRGLPRYAENPLELADVLWVLLCIANQTGVDLTAALEASIEKKTRRDSTRHLQNEKLKHKKTI